MERVLSPILGSDSGPESPSADRARCIGLRSDALYFTANNCTWMAPHLTSQDQVAESILRRPLSRTISCYTTSYILHKPPDGQPIRVALSLSE
jgi:hypothetical protein